MLRKTFASIMVGATLIANAANPIPADPAVRIGTLDNGLTYYIRQNSTPAGQADFFIAQRVGSVNEEENQRGLAHFLEHMCFNGTAHFPGNSLISYLETIGVKFGANLNAYTSTDETVYNICQVPTTRYSSLDSCVMILSDWSGNLLLNTPDIDAERGVIMGEMRQRSSAGSRILEKIAPEVYQGGIYGSRMPIGKAEIVENFDPETLRAYYRKWYHPSNQAVIVVGDVDPDKIEASIRNHFATVKEGPESVKANPVEVADNESPIAVVGSDPEQAQWMVQLYVKQPTLQADEEGTIAEVTDDYMRELIVSMLVERFDALEQDPDCPWSNLGIGDQRFILSGTRDALMLRATAADGEKARKAMDIFNHTLRQAALHGFTESELRRAKLSAKAQRDTQLANASKESNTSLAKKYVKNFTRGSLIPSTEQLYKMMNGVERLTTLEKVNARMAKALPEGGRNEIMIVYAPAKEESQLSSAMLLGDFSAIDNTSITPYVDEFAEKPIMSTLPTPGKIVKSEDGPFSTRLLTLSNGIKVYLRHSDQTPDQVLVRGISDGGFSMHYDPSQKGNYKMTDDVLAISGYGGHTSSDFRKLLAGHNVKSAVKIGNMNEELIAITTPADLATALQVLYLKATTINRDENAFAALMATTRSKLANPNPNATIAMGDSIHTIVYGRHPLGDKLHLEDLDKVDYDSIVALHNDRFSDMGDFTFIITGNYNNDSIDSLVETYIASLPAAGRKERPRDIGYGFFKGNGRFDFTHPMEETPQSIAYTFFNGECDYNLENIILAQTFGQIVKSRLMAELREKRGLTYGINSHCSVTAGFNGPDTPARFIMPVYVKVAPGHEEEVFEVVNQTIADMVNDGPTDEELLKVKAYLEKSIADNRNDNAYWETVIKVKDLYGPDMDSGYEEILSTLTPARIRDFAARHLPTADTARLSMTPAK